MQKPVNLQSRCGLNRDCGSAMSPFSKKANGLVPCLVLLCFLCQRKFSSRSSVTVFLLTNCLIKSASSQQEVKWVWKSAFSILFLFFFLHCMVYWSNKYCFFFPRPFWEKNYEVKSQKAFVSGSNFVLDWNKTKKTGCFYWILNWA